MEIQNVCVEEEKEIFKKGKIDDSKFID